MHLRSMTLLILAVGLGGCGGSGDVGSPYDTGEVLDLFKDRTGVELIKEERRPPGYDLLAPAAEDDLALGRKYGAFTIYVTEDDEAAADLLVAPDNPLKRDAAGIYWERQKYEGSPDAWGAYKLYDSVVLYWQGGEQKETDGRFDRLDEILMDLD